MGARFGRAHAFGDITIWIVLGEDQLPAKAYMPLDDAMRAKQVTVHETGDVDKLRVETTGESDVFIQAGDIVKGGRQDRVIRGDVILSDGSMIVPAYCVEQGRWAKRGAEAEGSFSGSMRSIVGRKLKMSTLYPQSGSQHEVWQEVGATQSRLTESIGHSVISDLSRSSLDLSLENEALAKNIAQYTSELVGAITDEAIGFAYAIRGEPAGLEMYGTRMLFRAMWPKLLKTAVTEALSEAKTSTTAKKPDHDPCGYFIRKLGELEDKPAQERQRTPRMRITAREDESAVLVETHDEKFGRVMHRRLVPKAA